MKTHNVRLELHRTAMAGLGFDPDEYPPTDIDTLHEIDETIYRLDMPDHGATAQIYGYYNEDAVLQYALAGVQGEAFTLIYDSTIGADEPTIDDI